MIRRSFIFFFLYLCCLFLYAFTGIADDGSALGKASVRAEKEGEDGENRTNTSENFAKRNNTDPSSNESNTGNEHHNSGDDYEDFEKLTMFPDPNDMYVFLFSEDEGDLNKESILHNKIFEKMKGKFKNTKMDKATFLELYKTSLHNFDVDGYNFLMEKILHKNYNERFVQKVKTIHERYAHCDYGKKNPPHKHKLQEEPSIAYPGGPIRSTYGSNLSKWMKDSLENVETSESLKEPGLSNMIIQSLIMVKGLIQAVASSVVDIVPPLIPPPFWINRPLPCLPMLTGKHCLGSVLYPITAAEFVTADITDSIMGGIISSFPSKYAAKVGRTSEAQYRICAMAYLGMYCASIFPICWMPLGLKVQETLPLCFPQCLATLIACPGFWMEDIEGPCSEVSVPPFCSFSIFVNQKIVPPQLVSYDESHSYPATCPKKDDSFDISDDLYEHGEQKDVFQKEIDNYSNVSLPTYPSLVKDLHVDNKEQVQPCKCLEIIELCRTHFALPVAGHDGIIQKKHETPVKLSEDHRKCCQECKAVWHVLYSQKKLINLKGSPVYPRKTETFKDVIQH